MKIKFNLTLDQFIEIENIDHRTGKSTDSLFFVFVIILGIVACYSIFSFWEAPGEEGPVVVAFGRVVPLGEALLVEIGLVLPFAAIGIWVSQSRRKPKNRRHYREGLFERFYAGPRTFEAQETTWQFGFRESLDKRSWGDLTRMAKAGSCFLLQDLFRSYTLPESAISAEQRTLLENLCKRALVPKNSLLSIPMLPTARDYVTAMMRNDWWERPWQVSGFVGGALLFVSLMTYATVRSWAMVVYVGLLPLILALLLIQALRKYELFTSYRQRCFQTAEIGEDRICFISGTLRDVREIRIVQYRWLWKIRESRRMIFLYWQPKQFFLLPKAAFKSDELSRFRELVNSGPQKAQPITNLPQSPSH